MEEHKMSELANRIESRMDNIPYYAKWQTREQIPIIKDFFVQDLKVVPLSWWDRIGGDAAFINMETAGQATGAYVCKIPAGKALKPQRHLYEEIIYVLKGKGASVVWGERVARQTFEWQEGSLFAIPLNAWHQYFNGEGNEPTRFLSVNNMPIIFNILHNPDFIYNTPYDFTDRFQGEANFFSGRGKSYPGRIWETNFVPDARFFNLQEWKERGHGSNALLELASGVMAAHISEFPVGTYKKAHRHGPGFNIVIVQGKGYSLSLEECRERKVKVRMSPFGLSDE